MAVKKITLKELRDGTEHLFDFDHALNLLRLQNRKGITGWKISDPKWKFEDNDISRRKPSNRKSKETSK